MLKIATVFSGIGAFEHALIKKNIKHKICFACDTGEIYLDIDHTKIEEEIASLSYLEKRNYIDILYRDTKKENHVKNSYFSNYDIQEENWYTDIRFLDGKKYRDEIDIFVGGSPCQSFSIIGKKAGLEDSRGTLFFEYARIIEESQPKVFIYENVTGMMSHDKGNTWKVIREVFDSLNYEIHFKVLDSKDYGIPQKRKRIFVVGFKKTISKTGQFKFPQAIELNTSTLDYLEDNNKIDYMHYLGKKGFEFVTNPKYKNRARVNHEIIQTQKANQQYNWNGDFIFVDYEEIKNDDKVLGRAHIGSFGGKKGVIRQMTNRECLRLMGFSDEFKIVVPRTQSYRQAGNSIVVNVMEHLIESIMEVVDLYEEN